MFKQIFDRSLVLFRRKQFLINPKFQLKYIVIVLALVVVILFSTAHYVKLTLRTTTLLENLNFEIEAGTHHIVFNNYYCFY